MELQSQRLRLRLVSHEDLDIIHELHSLPETDRYNTLGIPTSVEQTQTLLNEWIEEYPTLRYTFYIETPQKQFVGLAGIKIAKLNYRSAELWYKIHPREWNKGYATELVKQLLKFCFGDLDMHRVEAGCASENMASKKVLEKNGFLVEGLKRKKLPIRGEWHDNYHFAILEEDFKN